MNTSRKWPDDIINDVPAYIAKRRIYSPPPPPMPFPYRNYIETFHIIELYIHQVVILYKSIEYL